MDCFYCVEVVCYKIGFNRSVSKFSQNKIEIAILEYKEKTGE